MRTRRAGNTVDLQGNHYWGSEKNEAACSSSVLVPAEEFPNPGRGFDSHRPLQSSGVRCTVRRHPLHLVPCNNLAIGRGGKRRQTGKNRASWVAPLGSSRTEINPDLRAQWISLIVATRRTSKSRLFRPSALDIVSVERRVAASENEAQSSGKLISLEGASPKGSGGATDLGVS